MAYYDDDGRELDPYDDDDLYTIRKRAWEDACDDRVDEHLLAEAHLERLKEEGVDEQAIKFWEGEEKRLRKAPVFKG